MNIFKEIIANEVYPALGCTEPISCAYAAATASANLPSPVERLVLKVDRGTYKNGAGVTVPHSGGAKGNLIAAALGAVLARPEAKMELLRDATPEILQRARALCEAGACESVCLDDEPDFRVDVAVTGGGRSARCILVGGHTHVERIEKDGKAIFQGESRCKGDSSLAYREAIKQTDLRTMLALADRLDDEDRAYLRRGVEMNLALAEQGFEVRRTAYELRHMNEKGYLADDIFYRMKLRVGSAVDARMAGLSYPAMTSGGSGNQGIVAILTTQGVGREMGVAPDRIIESLAVSHAVNAYVKCFLGEMSVICGCAMGAGVASAAAIVYQQAGADMNKITLAVNNVIGDLGGLICDGAKAGCAMKAVTSVGAAMRAAFMAMEGYGLTDDDGVVGKTAEDSIRNLGRITLEGMFQVDPTVLKILRDKALASGSA